MRILFPLLAALGVCLALAALCVPRAPTPAESSAASAGELLLLALDPAPGAARTDDAPPLWRALLASPAATHSADGVTLALGRVQADPSRARTAAEAAGALLRLPVRVARTSSATQPDEQPLWRVLLDSPAAEHGAQGIVLKLNGCRHTAELDAGPVLEDTYAARLALAHELRAIAAEQPELGALEIRGEQVPVRGGANFELRLTGDTQTLTLTFDGHRGESYTVERTFRSSAPNDAAARASVVRALLLAAAQDGAQALTLSGQDAPAPGGVDLRLELLGEHQSLCAQPPGAPALYTHRTAAEPRAEPRARVLLLGAALLSFVLGFALRPRSAPRITRPEPQPDARAA